MVSWTFYTRLGQISRVLKDIEKGKIFKILAYVRICVHNMHGVQHMEDADLWKKKEWQ